MRHEDALIRCFLLQETPESLLDRVKLAQRNDENSVLIHELRATSYENGQPYKDFEVANGILYRFVDGARLLSAQVIRAIHEQGHEGR